MTKSEENRVAAIATPAQSWARAHGACHEGRRRLGLQSIGAYWNSRTANAGDLVWIARKIAPAFNVSEDRYSQLVGEAYKVGPWATKRTREALLSVFRQYNVSIPARLL